MPRPSLFFRFTLLFVPFLVLCGITLPVQAQPFYTLTTLTNFSDATGYQPTSDLVIYGDTLFGGTSFGGTNGGLYSVSTMGSDPLPLASASFYSLYSTAGLTINAYGNTLYAVASYGGAYNDGAVYAVSRTGGPATIVTSFSGTDGQTPFGDLILSGDGATLYGTTSGGGASGYGTVYSVPVVGGSPKVLTNFNGSNGSYAQAGLTLSRDGTKFYGTTGRGGAYGHGEIFSLPVTGGTPTVLTSFYGSNGDDPMGRLTLSPDGKTLYGTTYGGGTNNEGTAYSVPVTGGNPTVLAYFADGTGDNPHGGVTLSADGTGLYGTTESGGANGYGEVFLLPLTGGVPTLVASFKYPGGYSPVAGLTLGPDGTLYGTTEYGGTYGEGTVFALVPAPTAMTLAFSPNPVQVGQTVVGTVTLPVPAPAEGTAVTLRTNGVFSKTLSIPSGQTTGQYSLVFGSTYAGQTLPMTASANGATAITSLPVTALPYSLTSISPSSVILGGPDVTLSVTGTGFAPTNIVRQNGVALPTTFVSNTLLTASISASLIARPNSIPITVTDATQGGGGTDALRLSVNNPLPVLGDISPTHVKMGSDTFTLTVDGSGFTPYDNNNGYLSGSVVRWSGTNLPTTYVSSTQITASVPASSLTNAGTVSVTVFNPSPGGGVSSAQTFTVDTTAPTPTSFSPAFVVAGGPDFTLTIMGINFTPTCTVTWNGTNLTTTYVSPTQLTVLVPAALTANPALNSINVTDTSTSASSSATFTVANPVPTLSTISPATAMAGSPNITLTLTGTGFTQATYNGGGYSLPGSSVTWNGQNLSTTYVSSTQLTAIVPASLLTTAGTVQVTVSNSNGSFTTGGGGTSNALPFTIVDSGPAVFAINPSTAIAGGPVFTLTVTGTNFTSVCAVQWGTQALATTYLSPTQLTASVPASYIAGSGNVTIRVKDNSTGAVSPSSASFFISIPVPTLSALNPASTAAGSAALMLSVTGTGFTSSLYQSGSYVQWNGQAITTAYVSPTQLTANVPASYLASAGMAQVTVVNPLPGAIGSPSNALTFTITAADMTAPATSASLSGTAGTNGWYTSSVQVTLSAADNAGGSGVASTFYTVDNGAQATYSAPFTVSGDGTHTVIFYSTDNAGNTESAKMQTVKIDGTPPTLIFGTPSPAPNAAGWNNGTVSLPYTASDATSGVASATPGSVLIFAGEGASQTQAVTVTDNAGNDASFITPAVNIDLTAPATVATVNGTTVTLAATDALSGVAATYDTVDSGAQQLYTTPVVVIGSGTHTVTFWSVDVAGNTEAAKTQPVTIAAPITVIALSLSPTSVKGGATTSTGTVTLSGPASSGGLAVKQTSSDTSAATLAPTLNIPAGATSAKFKITTYAVTGTKTVTITSFANGSSQTAALTVTGTPPPVTVTALSLSPASIPGGSSSTATVTLSVPAPSGGAQIGLLSSDTASATVPASVTVASGQTTAQFSVTSKAVTVGKTVTVTATLGSSSQGATLTVTPAAPLIMVLSLSLSPTSVKGGAPSTGTITLSAPAPTGGVSITQMSSDTTAATLAPKLNIVAGATSAKFKITTYAVTSTKTVTIISSLNGATKAQTLTVAH